MADESTAEGVSDNGLGLFLTALPAPLAIGYAVRAEARGFHGAWFPEITFADSFVPATAAAMRTTRIRIGTGVVGIWSRSAVTMALQAATLHQLGWATAARTRRPGARLRRGLARPALRAADRGDARLRDDSPPSVRGRGCDSCGRSVQRAQLPPRRRAAERAAADHARRERSPG